MTDRIKQMAEEARDHALAHCLKHGPDEFGDAYRIRFAQLVAEDCAKHCETLWMIDGTGTAGAFGYEIRARYGIKE